MASVEASARNTEETRSHIPRLLVNCPSHTLYVPSERREDVGASLEKTLHPASRELLVSPGGRCVLWTSMPFCGIVGCRGVRHGPREAWGSAHLLRHRDQPLPGLSPWPRGGAYGLYLRARTPRGPDQQPKRARVWELSWSLWSS